MQFGERDHQSDGEYREVSDFFNIREANPQVARGQWEIEVGGAWVTNSDGTDDDVLFPEVTLKYGFTDDFFVEIENLPLNLGDGGDRGNGDLALVAFYRFVRENQSIPAVAGWAEMRIPSGQGSSKVDAEFHANLTKTFGERFRVQFEGFVETANGGRGQEDENRRHFQWGLGPGLDYQFDEKTLGLMNYRIASSEQRGRREVNVL
ncbi:MAG: hypothetical protein ACE5K7_07255, partial [Phycisphaerae bacterium]